VLIVTEFGRTVETNGTGGTDHGTASVVLMAGGAVRGGRVVADWPGLSRQALFEGRDLRPTTDLQALLARLTSEHFALDPALVGRSLFPGSRAEQSWPGLLRN
ncbi:MAG TPA: DUF1501 domain-containing protein, partial [Kiloniellaceae bacterium]